MSADEKTEHELHAEIYLLRKRASSLKKRAMAALRMDSSLRTRQKRYEEAMQKSMELTAQADKLILTLQK